MPPYFHKYNFKCTHSMYLPSLSYSLGVPFVVKTTESENSEQFADSCTDPETTMKRNRLDSLAMTIRSPVSQEVKGV